MFSDAGTSAGHWGWQGTEANQTSNAEEGLLPEEPDAIHVAEPLIRHPNVGHQPGPARMLWSGGQS